MARLFLILLFLAACVAIVAIMVSIWSAVTRTLSRDLRPVSGDMTGDRMAPTSIRKMAYIALIFVLFGVASGWLGGL